MTTTPAPARIARTTLAVALAGGLAALGVNASVGIARPNEPPRAAPPWKGGQWEYATMTLQTGNAPSERGSPSIAINGVWFRGYNEISVNLDLLREARDVSEALEGLGGRGWDLVAYNRCALADNTDRGAIQTWIFKRPRPRP